MPPLDGDVLALYGQRFVQERQSEFLKLLPSSVTGVSVSPPQELRFLPQLKVGILGAGVGGLYAALILDSLGIEYDILEASDRIGGRILTHKFKPEDFPDVPLGDYDYYEPGAMRFPLPEKDEKGRYKNGVMRRLGELIEYGPLNTGEDKLREKLIPFYYYSREGPCFFYLKGDVKQVNSTSEGILRVGEKDADDPSAVMNDVVAPFVKMLAEDRATGKTDGWALMRSYDSYSVRAYMASKYLRCGNPPRRLSSSFIDKCELTLSSTRAFDSSFIEWVLESLAFAQVPDSGYGAVEWKCFKGGTETLTKKMAGYITGKREDAIQTRKRVSAIGKDFMVVFLRRREIPPGVEETDSPLVDAIIHEDGTVTYFVPPRQPPHLPPHSHSHPPSDLHHPTSWMRIKVPCISVTANRTEIRKYSHVISTLTLPVLRSLDLDKAGLDETQTTAIRALNYWPSVKIAILFKTNWWTRNLGIVGGQTFTDLPIRTIVYPSYGDHSHDSDLKSACKVLLASYSWTNDANRLAPLAPKDRHEELKELVLRNLTEAHIRFAEDRKIPNHGITYEFLQEQFVTIDVKDWSADEYIRGAFAFFSPGDYENLYLSLDQCPAADFRLHFAGEAISTRHGWVVGAFDSVWKSIYKYLQATGQDEKIKAFKEKWGANVEWLERPSTVESSQ